MNRILDILYTISTFLIIIGALFILQDEKYGILILSLGIGFNVLYRGITLNLERVKKAHWLEITRGMNILFMSFALISFFFDLDGKFSYLVLTIVLDLLLNLKEISFRKKR